MKSRIVVLLIAISGLWVLMIGRAAYLQLLPNARLQALQKRQFETVVTLKSRRGDVLDRKGRELAVSTAAYSLFADPKLIERPGVVAVQLSKILDIPSKEIIKKIKNKKSRFVWIERRMDSPQHEQIEVLKIHGLGFIDESKRVYPNESLLAPVLGFVGGEGKGLEGLEAQLNEQLEGTHKKVSLQRDAHGRPLIVNGQLFNESPDGAEVQLTIDRELQFQMEQELRSAVIEHQADSAVGIVLDAQTSEILAMASAPVFDSNRAASVPAEIRRNRPVTDVFEPGSVMKIFTIASALKAGMLEPNTKYNCEGGQMRIGKHLIHEAESKDKWGWLTASEILAHSSNVGASKIALQAGAERVRQTLQDFGFDQKTGIDLPGEAKGVLHALPWGDHQLANISFGQGVMASPLQIANAYAAIANGGLLKRPYIVKSIRDVEANETTETQPKTVARVLTPEQASKLRLMLMGVVSKDGTGYNARVPGFPVAGKTGTAQRVNPNGKGYAGGGYISSFAGFLPANDPKFVIYVALVHPRKDYFGGAAAAPVFAQVAKYAVRQSGLSPILFTQDDLIKKKSESSSSSPTLVRALAGKATKAIASTAAVVFHTAPKVVSDPQEVANIAQVVQAENAKELIVPELTGLSLREVLNRVGAGPVSLNLQGQGFVTQTIPAAGTKLAAGHQLTVVLSRK